MPAGHRLWSPERRRPALAGTAALHEHGSSAREGAAGERLVGILSRRDLLRTLVRSDDEVAGDVQRLVEAYTGEGDGWSVRAADGVVTVRRAGQRRPASGDGTGDPEVLDRGLSTLARTVPGVIAVVVEPGAGARASRPGTLAPGRAAADAARSDHTPHARPGAAMTDQSPAPVAPVVVGVDGSLPATEAARAAATEAARRGAPLHLVRAFSWPARQPAGLPADADARAAARRSADADLHRLRTSLAGRLPAGQVRATLVDGTAADVLRAAAGSAALVVVGAVGLTWSATSLGT
ncbi:universal stress protein [Modestobacter sp. SYSU DS0657]